MLERQDLQGKWVTDNGHYLEIKNGNEYLFNNGAMFGGLYKVDAKDVDKLICTDYPNVIDVTVVNDNTIFIKINGGKTDIRMKKQ